jgi:hypothetical protein
LGELDERCLGAEFLVDSYRIYVIEAIGSRLVDAQKVAQ